jgi:hypothetical protein
VRPAPFSGQGLQGGLRRRFHQLLGRLRPAPLVRGARSACSEIRPGRAWDASLRDMCFKFYFFERRRHIIYTTKSLILAQDER